MVIEVSGMSQSSATDLSGSAAPPSPSAPGGGAFDESGAEMPYSDVESLQT